LGKLNGVIPFTRIKTLTSPGNISLYDFSASTDLISGKQVTSTPLNLGIKELNTGCMKWYLLFIFQFTTAATFGQLPVKPIWTNADKTLIPEGIAVDDRSGKIFISSINRHKIIAVTTKGKVADFIHSDQHGFLEGLGMKVDGKRKLLWALSNKKENGVYTSQLQAFDLSTAAQKVKHVITDTVPHLLNDMVIVNDIIYITDTYYSAVYQLNIESNVFSLLKKHPHLTYPNGITADKERHRLYIATYSNGIIGMDIKTLDTFILPGARDAVVVKGLDGLVYLKPTLIGVFNLGERNGQSVRGYVLDEEGRSISAELDIDKGNSLFHDPTTLAVRKRFIYVIANSHLDEYNKNKESTEGIEDQLTSPVIIRYKLKM
jgi:hypothetical protein